MRPVDEPTAGGGAGISTWPAPPPGWATRFDLAVSGPDPSDLSVLAIGAVGSVVFADGVASPSSPTRSIPAIAKPGGKRERETVPPMAPAYVHSIHRWGTSAETGAALLLDLGDPNRL